MNFTSMFSFLRDDSPFSTMRLAIIFIIVLFVPWFTFVWVKLSLTSGFLAIIPESVQWLLSIVLGAKIAQKGLELAPMVINAFKNTSTPEGQDVSTDAPQKTDTPK